MSYQWVLAFALHQLGVIVWIGGMFFAHVVLRPAAADLLPTPQRLELMLRVFNRFFVLVWGAILFLWTSGLWIFLSLYGGKAGHHVHAMMGLAFIMTVLFLFIWIGPYRRMKAAVAAKDWIAAGERLSRIRGIILLNLLLGLITAVLGVTRTGL